MAKITNTKKRRLIKTSDEIIEKKPKADKLKQNEEQNEEDEDVHDQRQPQSDSDSDSDSSSSDVENLSQLLEPYSKEQLIELITEAASKDSALLNRIRDAADGDVSHRKIFVHGLGWDTTRETLVSAFEPFGEMEECNLVLDKATGKAKGYGFVLFKRRRAATKALKDPKKNISNRIASCQLASVGPASNSTTPSSSSSFNAQSDSASRKIYVASVPHDVDGGKLRNFFAKFGEIETGPLGFDSQTGKSRGFALFVYKTVEGAKRALEEPHKVFEGHQLQCQKATEGSKNKSSAMAPPQAQIQQSTLAAVAAAQNMAMFAQHPSLPLYSGLMGNVGGGFVPGSANPALVARALNPGIMGGALNPGIMGGALNPGVIPVSQVGAGVGGYSGGSHGLVSLGAGSHGLVSLGGGSHGLNNPSLLGAYGTSGSLPTPQGLQHVYPNAQVQQPGSGRPQGAGGSFTGYPSYM